MLIKAINEVSPRFVACAFDTQAPTFRHIEFEKYKAQRVAPPPDLYPQLPKVKKVLDAYGIKYFEKETLDRDEFEQLVGKPVSIDGETQPKTTPKSASIRKPQKVAQA